MTTGRTTVAFTFWSDYGDLLGDVRRIQNEMDFTLAVLEGINAIQYWQRKYAPVGKGKGVHGRIPKKIKSARIMKRGDIVSATSRTTYAPAIFTNEGTGTHRPGGKAYFVRSPRGNIVRQGERGYMHPGVKGTHWWERGADKGSKIALEAFRRKVETTLTSKGRI